MTRQAICPAEQINNINFINMTIKKFDYSKSTEDIFYKLIYPVYAREFLFGNNYEQFAFLVEANFILNAPQWEYILEHWEQKESILIIETK